MAKQDNTDKKPDDSKGAQEKPSPKKDTQKHSGGKFAIFQNKYFIDLSNQLDNFSTKHVKAYSTGTSKSKPEGFFAMICNPQFTPRTNVTKHYKNFANPSLPQLIAYGRATMPNGTGRYVYIYQDNLGKRLYEDDNEIAKGWKTDRVLESLLIPIVMALKELQQRDVTHGSIRATNLYDGNSNKFDKIKLGECLSAPGSFNQPALYEPIERAMADPIGRGEGTILDDLYSLGVVLAMHVRNFDPLRGKTEDEIISAKVVNGSYSALIGSSDRVASGISDLLRGLLIDVQKGRWTLEDVLDWLDGRRQNSKKQLKVKKAARAIEFGGTSFFYARTFAYQLMKKPQDAIPIIESNAMHHWVERSLADKDMLDRIALSFKAAEDMGKGVGYWDRLLPLLSISLDPYAPIRYRSLSFHIDALGNALADSFIKKKGLGNFMELFSNGIITFWITICMELKMDVAGYAKTFDIIRGYLKQNDMINGIERCLYFLNPSIHCLSPVVEDYYATDTNEYLISLESAASKMSGKYPDKIIDKHAACFLISRDQKLIEPHTYDLSSKEQYRYVLANLKILAAIQKFNDIPPLPHMTEWFMELLESVIQRYHDTEQQKKIIADLAVKKENGKLSDILLAVESPEKIKKDQVTYRRAIVKYRELENERTTILKKLEKPKYFSERTGREWAATISGIISVLIIIGFLVVHYSGGPS